jgi:poly(3-hydroxybutyrate) depolymerase
MDDEMKTRLRKTALLFWAAGLLATSLMLAGCGSTGKDFAPDFETVHSPVNNDPNTYLIFGRVPIAAPAQGLSPQLAALLGRWEGYDYSPPVKKDYKIVLVIQDISAQAGKAVIWLGTNLQYPSSVQEIQFKVIPGDRPAIEFAARFGNATKTLRLMHAPDKNLLISPDSAHRPLVLSQAQTFYVYKDYRQYLASKRISTQTYQNKDLSQYGQGYMLYLPEGYEENPAKTWPLIFFLHGVGDRGDNINLLAKASPFMMIREKGPLPFIIVAPLLNTSHNLFPPEYLSGVLAEAQAAYRVDPKRIYATGLSLGGIDIYRFAIQHPDTFAAIAPLSAYADSKTLSKIGRIKDLPVWAIHGADDTIIPLAIDQKTVDALKAAGGNVKFTVLAGHDHDTWDDTYSDPAFYDWLLQHQRP